MGDSLTGRLEHLDSTSHGWRRHETQGPSRVYVQNGVIMEETWQNGQQTMSGAGRNYRIGFDSPLSIGIHYNQSGEGPFLNASLFAPNQESKQLMLNTEKVGFVQLQTPLAIPETRNWPVIFGSTYLAQTKCKGHLLSLSGISQGQAETSHGFNQRSGDVAGTNVAFHHQIVNPDHVYAFP